MKKQNLAHANQRDSLQTKIKDNCARAAVDLILLTSVVDNQREIELIKQELLRER